MTVSSQFSSLHIISVQINRKLVKQTVMTSVYGVTFVGARMQIFNRLKERGRIQEQTEMYRAACYAAKVGIWATEAMFWIKV